MDPALLHKIQAGDPLSDEELDEGVSFFGRLEADLRLLGPHYHLAWQEVHRTWMMLRGYRLLRARKALASGEKS